MTPRRVLVVGGSIAALTAVDTLRAEGFDGQITLLSDEARGPYTRVPLSKAVLLGAEPATSVLLDVPDGVDLVLASPARRLDAATREVCTDHTAVPYDRLVIATGARARRIGTPDQNETVLRSYDDGLRLREVVLCAASVVIVGGGVLGMEIASSCANLGLAVTVIDVAPPLQRLLGPVLARTVCEVAELAGVRIVHSPGGVTLLGTPMPKAVRADDGTVFAADLVVTACGDIPNVEWLRDSGLAGRDGIVVDDRCSAGDAITAAGDVAVVGSGPRTPPGPRALAQGGTAALSTLYGQDTPALRPSRYMWTTQFGLDIKLAGRPGPEGDPDVVDGDLADLEALLHWSSAAAVTTALALNHPTSVGKLKRAVRGPT